MLDKDPSRRPTMGEVLAHPAFTTYPHINLNHLNPASLSLLQQSLYAHVLSGMSAVYVTKHEDEEGQHSQPSSFIGSNDLLPELMFNSDMRVFNGGSGFNTGSGSRSNSLGVDRPPRVHTPQKRGRELPRSKLALATGHSDDDGVTGSGLTMEVEGGGEEPDDDEIDQHVPCQFGSSPPKPFDLKRVRQQVSLPERIPVRRGDHLYPFGGSLHSPHGPNRYVYHHHPSAVVGNGSGGSGTLPEWEVSPTARREQSSLSIGACGSADYAPLPRPPHYFPPPPQLTCAFSAPQLHLKIPDRTSSPFTEGSRTTPSSPFLPFSLNMAPDSPQVSAFTPRALYVGNTNEVAPIPFHPRQSLSPHVGPGTGAESPIPMAPPEFGGGSGSFVLGSRGSRPKSKLKKVTTK